MGIRDTLNKNPQIMTGIAAGIVLIAVVTIIWQLMGGPVNVANPTNVNYSTDDGKTWFEDSPDLLPPFQKDGAEAVRAYVYTCDGTEFVGYLEKMSPQYLAAVQAADAEGATSADRELRDALALAGMLIKKPGEKKWVAKDSSPGVKVMEVACPSGDGTPQLVK